MFFGVTSFKRNLCGAVWVYSIASKNVMFTASRGSISREVCTSVHEKTPAKELLSQSLQPGVYRPEYCHYNICFHIEMRGSSVARIWSCYIFAVPFALAVGSWIRTENKHSESRDVLKPGWSYLSSTGQLSYRLKTQ